MDFLMPTPDPSSTVSLDGFPVTECPSVAIAYNETQTCEQTEACLESWKAALRLLQSAEVATGTPAEGETAGEHDRRLVLAASARARGIEFYVHHLNGTSRQLALWLVGGDRSLTSAVDIAECLLDRSNVAWTVPVLREIYSYYYASMQTDSPDSGQDTDVTPHPERQRSVDQGWA